MALGDLKKYLKENKDQQSDLSELITRTRKSLDTLVIEYAVHEEVELADKNESVDDIADAAAARAYEMASELEKDMGRLTAAAFKSLVKKLLPERK